MSYSNVNLAYSLRSNYRNETPYTLEKNTYSRKMLEKYYNDTQHRLVSCLDEGSESECNNNPKCMWTNERMCMNKPEHHWEKLN